MGEQPKDRRRVEVGIVARTSTFEVRGPYCEN